MAMFFNVFLSIVASITIGLFVAATGFSVRF